MTIADKIQALEVELAALKAQQGEPVSPLAPASFPDLPAISGVQFVTAAAGVKYQGRDDVMLAHVAPGSAIAGVLTNSATSAAPEIDYYN